jgi:hypothetical protein
MGNGLGEGIIASFFAVELLRAMLRFGLMIARPLKAIA